jgi:hypothetical protein
VIYFLFHEQNGWRKKPMGNFFKLNALKSKGLSLGIASIMIFKGAIFPWRKGLGCLGEQLH